MDRNTFFVRGDIDMANADGLLTTLRTVAGMHSGDVEVDCMDLTFIDAAGLRSLIRAHAELAQEGRDLIVVHPSPMLTRILQVLDLTYLLRPIPLTAPMQQTGSAEAQ
jgi:anti-sigma B factor antagonist